MLTFFTTAKPFRDHSGIIQRNALQSWKLLHPDVEVILFGNDEGSAQVCAELGIRHEPHVDRNEFGLKYLNYMFERTQNVARHKYLCYSNCDIALMEDFWSAFERAIAWRARLLMVGRRWDTTLNEPIDFSCHNWQKIVRQLALTTGHRQKPECVDFFVFSKDLYDSVPPLVVGRSYWDHWLVAKALDRGAAVLDVSRVVVAVHQNHSYGYHPGGKLGTHTDPLALRNLALAGGLHRLCTIEDATHLLTLGGIAHNWMRRLAPAERRLRSFRNKIANKVHWAVQTYVWHPVLNFTRPLRTALGLRTKANKPGGRATMQ
jgi:hypothetical protein